MNRNSIGAVLGAALVLAIITGYVWLRSFARRFLRAKGRRGERRAETLGLPTTPFEVERPDGRIRGALLHGASGAAPTVIVTHGWQSHASDMLAYAEPLLHAGYHVALFDTLGHGESDATEFVSARHFTEDLLAVWRWASARSETQPGIALAGHSLGGTAALLAAAEGAREGLVPRAIVTIGSPSDPVKGTEEWLAAKGYPAALMMKAVYRFWRPIIVWEPERLKPVERAAEIRVPVLVLHGTHDRQIGTHHARRLAEAIPGARLELLEGADHWTMPKHPGFAPAIVEFLNSAFAGVARR
ncbi:MAG TPA: alpha/beta fold hydrolase [Gemmatimonadaceae bacterium]|nr:alpha/beta fold hydrolase [Gemmatimonadaceae bacterium]